MAWQDRLAEAAYTSPGGERLVFQYEDVSKSLDKKTAAFNFPDADGTYIQDLGHTGRRYPLRVFFWGADHDLEAKAFEAALLERGPGILDHPFYGRVDVVPFGTITQRDDLKSAANQSIVEVTFWETTGLIYPTSQNDPASDVLNAVEAFSASAAQTFANDLSLNTAIERASLRSEYLALLDNVKTTLQPIANTVDNVRTQFNAVRDSIEQGINTLIADPLSLGFQTMQLIQAPAQVLDDVTARLEGYGNLANSIAGGNEPPATQGSDARASNQFHARDLFATGEVSGSVVSLVNAEFETKPQALDAAEQLLDQFSQVTEWREENFDSLNELDTGAAYQNLLDSVALAAGFLVEISFSLKQERALVLDRARTIIDLTAELYGEIDSEIDFFIKSNNLSGSEILELPRGRRVVYYI